MDEFWEEHVDMFRDLFMKERFKVNRSVLVDEGDL